MAGNSRTRLNEHDAHISGMQQRTVAQAIIEALRSWGVDTIFGVGGTHTLALLAAIDRTDGVTFVAARTELGAAYMAVGFARACHRPAVVLTSTGPGALNVTAALQDASWSSVPLIHLTTSIGDGPFGGAVHETPSQFDIMRLAGKGCIPLQGEGAYEAVGRALSLATELPSGPVTLDVPAGSLSSEASVTTSRNETVSQGGTNAAERVAASLAEALRAARKPLIFVGGGALTRDDGRAVLELAERLGAPLVTSYQGKSIADWRHPLYLGPWASEHAVRELCAEADVAVVFGSKLSALGTAAWQLPLASASYRVTPDAEAHPHYPHLTELSGDASAVANTLLEYLSPRQGWATERVGQIRHDVLTRARERSAIEMSYVDGMSPAEFIAVDMTKAGFWLMKYLTGRRPIIHAFSSYLTMGTALPMAIGMTIARGRPTTALLGDGGLQMSLADLGTVAEYQLPITLVVVVDGAYGMLLDSAAVGGENSRLGLTLWNPELPSLAKSYGIACEEIHSAHRLSEVMAESVSKPRMIFLKDGFTRNW